MGKESNLQFNEKNAYAKSILSMNDDILTRSKYIHYYPDFIWNHTSMGKQQKKDLKILLDFTLSVIEDRWARPGVHIRVLNLWAGPTGLRELLIIIFAGKL